MGAAPPYYHVTLGIEGLCSSFTKHSIFLNTDTYSLLTVLILTSASLRCMSQDVLLKPG